MSEKKRKELDDLVWKKKKKGKKKKKIESTNKDNFKERNKIAIKKKMEE